MASVHVTRLLLSSFFSLDITGGVRLWPDERQRKAAFLHYTVAATTNSFRLTPLISFSLPLLSFWLIWGQFPGGCRGLPSGRTSSFLHQLSSLSWRRRRPLSNCFGIHHRHASPEIDAAGGCRKICSIVVVQHHPAASRVLYAYPSSSTRPLFVVSSGGCRCWKEEADQSPGCIPIPPPATTIRRIVCAGTLFSHQPPTPRRRAAGVFAAGGCA